MTQQAAASEVPSTCCYCGVGCGVLIAVRDNSIIGVRGDPQHPANGGLLCAKGSTLHRAADPANRVRMPMHRASTDQPLQTLDWDSALNQAAQRFADIIRQHGPDSVAFYVSGQLLTEDYYAFNKLAKGLIGTNNIDTNSRLCMSSAVAGYKATLGADAPPACYDDIDATDCLLIAGSNTAFAHPVLYRRIEAARVANPQLKTIVIDPRRTATAEEADLHLALAPGTDIALFNAMLHVLIRDQLLDQAFIAKHTQGFEALQRAVQAWTPERAAVVCQVPAADIEQAAQHFGLAGAALSLYCQGLNQSVHGTHNNVALINLHLATGHIGRPGAGPLSLTGQPNAMGGREVGGMANLLSAHRDLSNPQHRAEIARLWGVDDVPASPGKTAVELFHALDRGQIKAVWIACTNPAHSMPDQTLVRRALAKADYVVLQEAWRDTESVDWAHLLLPASTWGEKEGTVTNSERCISRVRAAVAAPGEARHDWQIARDFAHRLGPALDPVAGHARAARLFPWHSAQDIHDEHRATTRGRDLDITGLDYARLERDGPQQWPYPEQAEQGSKRLYQDGVFPTANGRAQFVPTPFVGTWESVDTQWPLHLNSGRLRDQWHSMSRTGRIPQLFEHAPLPLLSMHRHDMAARALQDGDCARVESRRGSILLEIRADDGLRGGECFLPMHWSSAFASHAGVNLLMPDAVDPQSRQPELKHAAIQVQAIALPYALDLLFVLDGSDAQAVAIRQLRALLPQLGCAGLRLLGRHQRVMALQARLQQPPEADLLRRLDAIAGLGDAAHEIRYDDVTRGNSRHLRLSHGRLLAARLHASAQDPDAPTIRRVADQQASMVARLSALMDQADDTLPSRSSLRAALSSVSHSGTGTPSRVVCSCFGVREDAIQQAISHGADIPLLKQTLRCGSNCGSCLPELRKLLHSAHVLRQSTA